MRSSLAALSQLVLPVALTLAQTVTAGCAAKNELDPRSAADAYAKAAAAGDADALYAMMSDDARARRTAGEVRTMVADERAELLDRANALAARDAKIEARAKLRFADGEEATLDLERHRYLVTTAGALPGGARTPAEALDELRRVMARRSYAGLMRVVSSSTRAAIEHDLRSLVLGLENPSTLAIDPHGDDADVLVPGGHHVKLKREGGIWRVDDFD